MRPVTCIIVDDEPEARRLLQTYLTQYATSWKIIKLCSNAIEAYEALQQAEVDVMFLDIKMPILSGIDFLKSLRQPPLVVFTTAYNKYAMDGYELDVVDYLLKPISQQRLLQVIQKVSQRLKGMKGDPPKIESPFMFVRQGQKQVKLIFNEIVFVEAMQNYVKVVTTSNELIFYSTMKAIEDSLPSEKFVRIHKSYLVNIDFIISLSGNEVALTQNSLPVGAVFRENLLKAINLKE